MKLQIDTEKNVVSSVTEQTGVIDVVASATRVFLGTTIGLGFVVSGMAFFLMSNTVLKTSGSTRVTNKPLTAVDVTGAISTMDRTTFVPLRYKVGTTTVYTQTSQEGNPDTNPGVKTGKVSIERASAVPGGSLPAQLIKLSYRLSGDTTDRNLTICLGPNSVSKVYVGSDGSTYTDSGLTKRTTVQPCATIVQRALKFSDIQSATRSTEGPWLFNQVVSFMRNDIQLGSMGNSDTFIDSQNLPGGFDDPLELLPQNTSGASTFPRSMFYLTGKDQLDQPLTATVCMPELSVPDFTVGPYVPVFFDRQGDGYKDLFLSERYITKNCADILAQGLKFSDIQSATRSTEGPWLFNQVVSFMRNDIQLGSMGNSDTFIDSQNLPGGFDDPLELLPQNTSGASTFPRSMFYLTGKDQLDQPLTATVCMPELSVPDFTVGPYVPVFFDRQGNPYDDIFLSQPVSCTSSGGGGGGIEPIEIQ